MDEKELKPCPFCSNADIQVGRSEIGNRPTFHTYCNGCEAGTQGHPTREASDEAWNRRAALPSDSAQAPNGWKLVPAEPTHEWVQSFCELTNRSPEGTMSTSSMDGWITSTFAQVAERELRAALSAAPVAPAAAAPRLTAEQVEQIMGQAQVFASAWSMAGSLFDDGDLLEAAVAEKTNLRTMLTTIQGVAL